MRRANRSKIHIKKSTRRWTVALFGAGVVIAAGFVVGRGALAARPRPVAAPTLENLIERRAALEPDLQPSPSLEQLRTHHLELRQRRSDIEGSLPPRLRTPRSRRPELRRPKRDLAGRAGTADLDSGSDNPDRVVFEVMP
jgi:hypothetical protein